MSRCLLSLIKQNHFQHYIKSSNILLFRRIDLRHYNITSSTSNSLFLLKHQNTNLQCLRFNHFKGEESDEDIKVVYPWRKIIIACILAVASLKGLNYFHGNYVKGVEKQMEHEYKRESIRANFKLIDTNGVEKKTENFIGKWTVILLGFTHYPQSCTKKLKVIAKILDEFETDSVKIQPIFVTIDPNNDTKETLRDYVKNISSKWIGLTGTTKDIQSICYSLQLEYDFLKEHKNENDKNTLCMYLVDPNGKFIDYFSQNANVEDLRKHIYMNIALWNAANEQIDSEDIA